ncbi:hypothetical protein FRC08_000094 [Ceratobasidium sp. 394]|nr:hypothetical protein FRC08_000094 [Ceratobasidium sp. 394]
MSTARSSTSTLHVDLLSSPQAVSHALSKTNTPVSPQAEKEADNTDVLRPAEGPGARLPAPEKFTHTVFDPKIAHLRKVYINIMGMTLVLTIIIMWTCLLVYWGSLAHTGTHAPSLKAWIIDRDEGEISQAVVQGLMVTTQSGTKQHLGWVHIPANEVGDVGAAIVDEQAWGAVVAITFYYAQARNEQATSTYVNPLTAAVLTQILQQYNAKSAAAYLSSISGNTGALQALASAPRTLNRVWWTREFGTIQVGSKYLIICNRRLMESSITVRRSPRRSRL